VGALQELRRLLSRSEFPPVESAINAGAVPLLVQCLSFGSPDEQVWSFIFLWMMFNDLYECLYSQKAWASTSLCILMQDNMEPVVGRNFLNAYILWWMSSAVAWGSLVSHKYCCRESRRNKSFVACIALAYCSSWGWVITLRFFCM